MSDEKRKMPIVKAIPDKKLKTIKFQGKPVKIVPLKNSKIPKIKEKVRKEVKIFFGFKIIKI